MARKRNRSARLLESTPLVEREFSADQRKKMADKGQTMSGGGFPIANESDLKNAIQAIGRASDPAAAKAHIIKRAKALGLTRLLPDGWLDSMSEADRSLFERINAVDRAIRAKYLPAPGLMPADECMPSVFVKEIFDSYAIVCKGDDLYRIDYTIADDGTVELAEPVSVAVTYAPVSEADPPLPAPARADPDTSGAPVEISEADATILEAKSPKGNAWDVLLIKAGTSGNRRHYPARMLKEAVPLFEGVKAYADHPSREEQRSRPERSIRDVVGWFEGVRWDDAEQGVRGTFKILESADWLRTALKSAWDQGKRDLLGFSINALGTVGKKPHDDGSSLIEAIEKVVSTDVVTTPGAGGRLLGVLESERNAAPGPEGEMDPEEIKRLIQEALSASTAGLMEAFDAKVKDALTEASKSYTLNVNAAAEPKSDPAPAPVTESTPPPATADPSPDVIAMQEALAAIQRQARRGEIKDTIRESGLPDTMAKRVEKRLLEALERRAVADDEVTSAIQEARDIIAEIGPARPNWGGDVSQGATPHQKMYKALQGWFQGEQIDGVPPVRDLRESFAQWTGAAYMDADPYEMFGAIARRYDSSRDHKRLQESLSVGDWGQAFADVFYLQMIRRYEADPTYDRWKMVVSDIESVPDFRTRHFIRIGGYGNFGQVPELGTYPELTTPGDEEVTYAVAKYGGIESVSMESLLGDRGNIVRRLPMLMAEGAARTLYEFVMDMVTTGNPTMDYDSTALYDNAHANTGTTALTVAGVDVTNIAMRSQTSFGNSVDILGPRNTIKNIIVPNELEGRAQRIANPSQAYIYGIASPADTETVQDPHRWAGKGLNVHVYDKLTDSTDWWATADPARVPTMVVGFLNGRQEPELFTQDQPNVGSMFTADRVSFKLRHVFGADILEHRSFYRQVVTGG